MVGETSYHVILFSPIYCNGIDHGCLLLQIEINFRSIQEPALNFAQINKVDIFKRF